MSIRITVSQHVRFRVEGLLRDQDGAEQPFDFVLTARRLSQSELDEARRHLVAEAARSGTHQAITQRVCEMVTAWDGVKDDAGEPVPYTQQGMQSLLDAYPGLALRIWQVYQDEAGARAKN